MNKAYKTIQIKFKNLYQTHLFPINGVKKHTF